MTKRLISLLLAVLCVCSLLVSAGAVDTEDASQTEETTAPADTADKDAASDASDADTPSEDAASDTDQTPAEDEKASEDDKTAETDKTSEDETSAEEESETEVPPAPTGPWYQSAMDYAVENHLLQGDEKGDLMPNNNATRAQVATILSRVFGLTKGKTITHYTDVNKDAWYYGPLSIATEMGIIKGDTDYTMRPNDNITRQEAFVIIARTFSVPTGKTSALEKFSDAGDISSWATKTLAGMVDNGLLKGSGGKLNPKANITRAEFAQVIFNLGIVFFSDPAELPEDGIAVYTGADALDVTDFAGTLYLAGADKRVTMKGDAPESTVYVRKNPGAIVTVSGNVGDVHVCTRDAELKGSGSAKSVELAGVHSVNSLATENEAVTYDAGLSGVTSRVNEPAALTPDNYKSTAKVTFKGMDDTGSDNGVRKCQIRTWVNGELKEIQYVNMKSGESVSASYQFTEDFWTRDLESKDFNVKFQLLYGTDCVADSVVVARRNYTSAEYKEIANNHKYPYKIEVIRNQCTVIVYGMDKEGDYSIVHKVYVCSPGWTTPIGTFQTGSKWRWECLMGGVWGQYCTQIYRGVLFHSVFYQTTDPSTLYYSAYNQLGTVCSHGCVRVTVEAAKWMYNNCPSGTSVHIYDSNSLPAHIDKPTAQKIPYDSPYRGWDPTDPDPNNPWKW